MISYVAESDPAAEAPIPGGSNSIVDAISASAQRAPNAVAVSSMGAVLTYSELEAKSKALAAWLRHKNLPAGACIAVALPNVMAYPVALLGVLRAGMTAVCMNPLYTSQEISQILSDSGASAAIVFGPLAGNFEAGLKKNDIRVALVVEAGDHLGWRRLIVNAVSKRQPGFRPFRLTLGACWRDVVNAQHRHAESHTAELNANATAVMLYSGGTTGVPKGAPLTHDALMFGVNQQRGTLSEHLIGMDEKRYNVLLAIPLYHVLGIGNLFFALAIGGRATLVMNPRRREDIVKEWRRHAVTSFPAVNTLFNALLAHKSFASVDFSTLRLCIGAGMPVAESTSRRWHELTGRHITEAYGMTETGLIACNPPGESRCGSVGLPVLGVELSLRDDDGLEIPHGPGEIYVRSRATIREYWNNPKENATAFSEDGFFRTGDIATRDADGYLKIVDRKKEMIISSGFKVFPSEVECVINSHPGVEESAVIARSDKHAGEVPVAYVVKRDPSLDEGQLRGFCEGKLANYKRPRYIEFVEDLPKSGVGKILRKDLVLREVEIERA
ncbi:AMP-binding protein [Cupriavidus sp. D384]|uniref:AMP-binding protein n=1 Tax=Cupriavidus sp. D384 TaxID=1538095 RepID=UPI0009EE732A|nr:AMP-binding protein [Cupriavidus sp. D384]